MAKRKQHKRSTGKVRKRKPSAKSKKSVASPPRSPLVLWRKPEFEQQELYRKIFWGVAAFFLLLMLWTAPQVGLNADDDIQNPYSDKLVDYYTSFGQDREIFDITSVGMKGQTIKYYGAIYELPAGLLNRMLGFESDEPGYHQVRHLLNALFGFFALLFAAFIGRDLGGWRTGVVVLLLLGLSPRFFGHAMMNPKDIPFACGYLMAMLYMIRLFRELPKPSWKTMGLLGAGIAIAIASRVGGLLLVAYLGLFLGLHFLLQRGFKGLADPAAVGRYARHLLIPTGIGLIGGLLFWPYGLENPIKHIPETLDMFTKFSIGVKFVFGGDMVWSTDIPRTYIPHWLLITTPTIVLGGLLLFLGFSRKVWTTFSPFPLALLGFAFLFPILYAIYKESSLYGGMRHFLFAYSCGLVLASLGWDTLLRWAGNRQTIRYAVIGVFSLLLLEPAIFLAQNRKLGYIYFNLPSGGINSAQGNYDLDHQGISTRQGIRWMEKEGILSENMTDTITIASNFTYGVKSILKDSYKDKVKVIYVRYRERYSRPWDYAIFLCHFMDGAYIREGGFPPSRSVHDIRVSDVPVAAVLKKGEDFAFKGTEAARSNDWQGVINWMEQEVAVHPRNEIAWQELGNAYMKLNQLEKAKNAIDQTLAVSPENLTSLNNLGLYYLQKGNAAEAIKAFENAVTLNKKNMIGYYYLAVIYKNQNNLNLAVDYAKKSVEANPQFKAAYQLTADIYDQMGDASMAQAYRNAMQKIN